MTVHSARTGQRFSVDDIMNPKMYPVMKLEVLIRDADGSVVCAVRRRPSGHFRKLTSNPFEIPLERQEGSQRHNETIAELHHLLTTNGLVLSTPTFSEGVRDPDGQTFHRSDAGDYIWFKDGVSTRIPVGNGRFIQPDLCGMPKASFHSSKGLPHIIIEVIHTHYPELGTMCALLELSRTGHVVVLHFISDGKRNADLSQMTLLKGAVKLREVTLLLDGDVVRNGEIVQPSNKFNQTPRGDGTEFNEWYGGLETQVLQPSLQRNRDAARSKR